MLTETENRELKAQQDGRIENLFVWHNGTTYEYRANFNDGTLGTVITKNQYESYKKFMTSLPEYISTNLIDGYKMVEFWGYQSYNNGLPNWFNKLF